MCVIPIEPGTPFEFSGPRAQNRVLEGLLSFFGIAMTCWVPTLMYCLATGQFLMLYLMLFSQSLGFVLGIFMYNKQSADFLSCITVDDAPDVPQKIVYLRDRIRDKKKAA